MTNIQSDTQKLLLWLVSLLFLWRCVIQETKPSTYQTKANISIFFVFLYFRICQLKFAKKNMVLQKAKPLLCSDLCIYLIQPSLFTAQGAHYSEQHWQLPLDLKHLFVSMPNTVPQVLYSSVVHNVLYWIIFHYIRSNIILYYIRSNIILYNIIRLELIVLYYITFYLHEYIYIYISCLHIYIYIYHIFKDWPLFNIVK